MAVYCNMQLAKTQSAVLDSLLTNPLADDVTYLLEGWKENFIFLLDSSWDPSC